MKPVIVRGHVCTWKITPTEDGQYLVTPGNKTYKDTETAKWAIRTAETRYVNDYPDCPVANRDIWFDHGTLIIANTDGNYYESVNNNEDYYHIEFTYNGSDGISLYIGTCKVPKKSVSNEKEALKKAKEYYDRNYPEYQAGFFKIIDKSYSNSTVIEAFDANKVKKRIARTDEFDNGHVIHDDYFSASSDEAEEKAKQMSIDNPGKTFYVKYDDIMNPSSDKKWKDGKEITESAETPNEMVDFINGLEWGKPDTKYGDEYDVVFVKDWDPEHKDCYVLQVEKVDGTIPFYCTIYHPGDMDRIKKQAIEAISSKEEVTESRNTTGRYVWCEYQYVKDKTPDQLKAFAQMAFNNRYNANAKVTHFEKERYDSAEGHCEYVMYADGLHENFDSFYFLVQCTKEEYEELPDSELYDAGDPARYYIDYFHWSHERCWVTGYDNDLDKDFELTLCNGVGDEDRGRKKALEILKDNDINVSEDARNEMISTFGLEESTEFNKGNNGPGILSKEWLDKNVPDKIDESKIETDPEKLATNVETTSEPQDDETLADKIENEIINGDTFVGRKCIYTYKGLIGNPGYSCSEFDEEENDLHKLSGTEVEVVSGCPEYGYLIKSGSKEYYGVRAEELVLHDTNDYGVKEVSLKESDDRSNANVVDCFTVNRTGMSFYDGFVDPDDKVNSRTTVSDYYKFEKGLSGRIVYMTADQYFKACSDYIFGTNLERVKRGISQDKVDQYSEDLKNGKKYRLPFLDYAQKQQEGRHRMAAVEKAFGKDAKAPVLVVEVSEVSSEDIEDYAIRRWGEKNKDWGIEYVVGVRKNIENKYYLDKYNE